MACDATFDEHHAALFERAIAIVLEPGSAKPSSKMRPG
jgi:hypothetical protein